MKDVYFNLHKKIWSLRDCKTRRVAGDHRSAVLLRNCSFRVSEAGRQRVIREKRKNVNAFVRGDVSEAELRSPRLVDFGQFIRVSYNPYKAPYFHEVDTGEPIHEAEEVYMFAPSVSLSSKPELWVRKRSHKKGE